MKKFGLIGKSLIHSFSRDYFVNKFTTHNIKAEYNNYELEDINSVRDLFINDSALYGLNVTIPYKEKVIKYLDSIDSLSRNIDSVNTIKRFSQNGKLYLKGYNTDVYGFKSLIAPYLQNHHRKALILGTGGASKAVGFVLQEYGIEADFITRKESKDNLYNWAELDETIIGKYQIIINTTPVGMFPKSKELIKLPYEKISDKYLLIDLIYNPRETLFLKEGSKRGAVVLGGYEMLIAQAEESWKIWNNEV
jgi:shikimate dehydrogenase